MELSSLSQKIITVPFERGGETVELQVDIDAITPAFFRKIGDRFKAKFKELQATPAEGAELDSLPPTLQFFEIEATTLELSHEVRVELLTNGILVNWDVTDKGKPVKPTKKLLLAQPPTMVRELWDVCLDAAKTVKKRPQTEEETSQNTHGGSMALRVVGQNT